MLYQSKLWLQDIDREIAALPELSLLAGKSVMITGAAGLVCSPVVDILIRCNEIHHTNIKIFAAGRHLETLHRRFDHYCEKDYFKFIEYDASRLDNSLMFPCDYIIHGAGNAFPDMITKEPVETMLSNFGGTYGLLDYARGYGIKRLLYISSSEVYGEREEAQSYCEDEYGYIDLLNPRNSYSVGKRAAETLCASYTAEYGIETVIVRPGHIYGPTASPRDNRVGSAWAYAAIRGENIVMKSDGAQLRSYCYCLDSASAILKVLLKGENTRAYNISNPDSIISIRQLAELYSKTAGITLVQEEASQDERKGFNPMRNSSLNSASLQSLGWKGLFCAEEGVSHTVSILKEVNRMN